jgi:hypothetical protein
LRLFGDTKWYGKNYMERNGLTVACVGPTDKRRLGAKFWTTRPGFEEGEKDTGDGRIWSLELLLDSRCDVRQERGQLEHQQRFFGAIRMLG